MKYDFDKVIERRETQSSKWDNVGSRVGNPDALPMWVADTDFQAPQPVVDAVVKRAQHPIYGYTFVVPEFQKVTVDWIKRRHGWKIQSEWLVFATGVVPVMNTMAQIYSEPGDEIVIQQPVYPQFANAVRDTGRIISDNGLLYKNGHYEIDFDDLERRASSPKAKLMFFCNPHNPSGRVWNVEELEKVAEICLRHHIILVNDEIHSDLIMFGHRHTPLASLNKRYAGMTVTCYAPSKTFNTAGLRGSGIVVPNPEIRAKLEKQFKKNRAIQQNIFALPAYIAAYTECDDYLEQLLAYLEGNALYIEKFLKEKMPKIKMVHPEATYLAWLDCSEMGMEGDALADFFINRCKVAINRGDSFGPEGKKFVRLNFGCPRITLEKGLGQIYAEYQKLFR